MKMIDSDRINMLRELAETWGTAKRLELITSEGDLIGTLTGHEGDLSTEDWELPPNSEPFGIKTDIPYLFYFLEDGKKNPLN